MSRITGTDAYNLMEAYNNVYAPQELTEDQVWEEVENWVNSLLEEGYDLSDYTWEEMYESYIEEQGKPSGPRSSGANPSQTNQSVNIPNPFPAISNFFKGSGGAGTTGGRQTNTRGGGQSRPQPTFQNTGGYGRYGAPGTQVRTPAPAPRQQAPAPRQQAPAPRQQAPAPARPAAPAPGATGTQKPTATTTPTPAPRVKDTSITDMIGRSQVRQGAPINTGNASSDARAIAARSSVGATPTTTAAKPAKTGGPRTRAQMLGQSFDPFDVVIGHLLDEGYADTEEAALKIMANMSEEWKETILGEDKKYDANRRRAAQRAEARNRARDMGQTGNVPGVGYVSPRRERETYRDSAGVERGTHGGRSKPKEEN